MSDETTGTECQECGVQMQKSNSGDVQCPYCDSWAFRDAVSDGAIYTTGRHAEYLRRNLIVAGAIGARAGCDTALDRLREQKGAPKWLIKQIESIRDRVVPTIDELAAWRAIAADAPIYKNGVKVR